MLVGEDGDLTLTYMCKVNELCDRFVKTNTFDLTPEIYGFEGLTKAIDLWSYGTILYELLVGLVRVLNIDNWL